MDQKSWKYPWTVWIFDFDHDPKTRSKNVIRSKYVIREAGETKRRQLAPIYANWRQQTKMRQQKRTKMRQQKD